MVQLKAAERTLIDQYCETLRRDFPGEVGRIILFGSRARGEGTPHSDIDLLIVLNTEDHRLKRKVLDLSWDVMFDHHFKVFLSPIVFFRKDYENYQRWNSSFLENVSRDAVSL